MLRSLTTRIAPLALAGAAMAVFAGPAAAVTPTVDTWTNHVAISWFECDGFTVAAEWDIHHKLTTYYDTAGVATRDIERIDFSGRLSNPDTGASVPDSGTRVFFDTLAPDGSFLTTYSVQVRKSEYIHVAGRTDFQTGAFSGVDNITDASIAALCEALGE